MTPISEGFTPLSINSLIIYSTKSHSPLLYFDSFSDSRSTPSYINDPTVSINSKGLLSSSSLVSSFKA